MAKEKNFGKISEEKKFHIKNRLSVLLRSGYNRHQSYVIMKDEGLKMSTKTLYEYADQLKTEWKENKNESYDQHVADQLAKLDNIESNLWEMFEASKVPRVKDSILYKIDKTSDEDPDLQTEIHTIGSKSEPTDENPKGGAEVRSSIKDVRKYEARKTILENYGDLEIIKEIKEIWKERNKILGIYSDTTLNVQNNFNQNNINNQNNVQPVSNQFEGNFIILEDQRKNNG